MNAHSNPENGGKTEAQAKFSDLSLVDKFITFPGIAWFTLLQGGDLKKVPGIILEVRKQDAEKRQVEELAKRLHDPDIDTEHNYKVQ